MNIIDIIAKKQEKEELTKEEISFFIKQYTKGNIPDYQASAFIMAVYLNGMTENETTNLTIEMANSGQILDLSEIGEVIDKHSTGGVGDKVTIILSPILACMGIKIAKMSGRGLGFTGGTADKLEAIPGYNVNISIDNFIQNVKEIGISLITQTGDLAPADKKIYALRDSINCIKSIPLIASSIMSKKIAAGANKILLDVTCGSGAFMKTQKDAYKLANTMKDIGKLANRETICVITNMDEPLGKAVGNTLEIIEVIEFLKGKRSKDLEEVVLTLGAYMIKLANKGHNIEENKKKMTEVIESGKALEKLKQLVKRQGGDVTYIEDTDKFEKAPCIIEVKIDKTGYISKIDAEKIGEISRILGAGRLRKEDIIDNRVGIILKKKVGDFVSKNDIIAYVYAKNEIEAKEAQKRIKEIYEISETKVNKLVEILGIVE